MPSRRNVAKPVSSAVRVKVPGGRLISRYSPLSLVTPVCWTEHLGRGGGHGDARQRPALGVDDHAAQAAQNHLSRRRAWPTPRAGLR